MLYKNLTLFVRRFCLVVISLLSPIIFSAAFMPQTALAAVNPQAKAGHQCGSGKSAVKTSIDFGCYGDACQTNCNALVDAMFAIMRILSAGVGIVIVGSTVFAGIQYITARDDPGAVGKAKGRIGSNLIALLIFIFGYAILNYVIPQGFFLN